MKLATAAAFGLVLGTWLGIAFGWGASSAKAQPQTLSDTTTELARIARALERIESKCCDR